MSNKQIICYKGNGCVNMSKFSGHCYLKGFKVHEKKTTKCIEYLEKRRYNY